MKRIIFALMVITAGSIPALAKYSGGSGDPNDPYQIANVADLLTLAADTNDYNQCFILTADIDLGSSGAFTTAVIASDTDNSNYSFEGVAFTGIFDGAGHKITNLTINTNGAGYLGLFGYLNGLEGYGEIKNLGLENVSVTGVGYSYFLGGLVGYNWGGAISNCYSTGAVTGGDNSNPLGGLVGYSERGSINNCFSISDVACGEQGSWLGGLAGGTYSGIISNCFSMGAITGGDSAGCLGGLVGGTGGSIISNCHSTGAITGGDGSSGFGGLVGDNCSNINNCFSTGIVAGGDYSYGLGGLVGINSVGSISNCYSTGDITGGYESTALGGLVGDNYGAISNCFSTGTVTGEDYSYYLGGLVGETYHGIISNCYSTGTVTSGDGSYDLGGLLGYDFLGYVVVINCYFLDTAGPNNGYGTLLTDEQMKQQNSFIGWDFVWEIANGPNDIWAICEGVSYPKLAWQFIVGDSDNDKDVDFVDFALMGLKWMQTDSTLYCGGMDLTGDGLVDIADLGVFCNYWIEGL